MEHEVLFRNKLLEMITEDKVQGTNESSLFKQMPQDTIVGGILQMFLLGKQLRVAQSKAAGIRGSSRDLTPLKLRSPGRWRCIAETALSPAAGRKEVRSFNFLERRQKLGT